MKCLGLFIFVAPLILTGCFPNTARTNAKIEDGFNFAMSAGLNIAPETPTDSQGVKDDAFTGVDFELDLGYSNDRFDFQFKAPLIFVFSAFDVYYLFSKSENDYLGLGLEIGFFPALYLAYTHYFSNRFFMTLTPRIIYSTAETGDMEASENASRWWINPQLSLGLDFKNDKTWVQQLAFYFAYTQIPGRGYNFDLGLSDSPRGELYRKHFLETGLRASF